LIKNFNSGILFSSMKPKDLHFPHSWEERRPALADGVLFVPDHYDKHRAWPFPAFSTIFGNDNPVKIEYCAGNGAWIIDKALKNPLCNWVAVEWEFERVRKIWAKAKNRGLKNLLIVCGEAVTFSRDYLPEKCVQEIFINFPDPWPKTKHAKNRLFQKPFVAELARILAPQGTVTAVTDDPPYGEQIAREMMRSFQPRFAEPWYTTAWTDYGASYFDSLWRGKGRTIRYFQFGRV